MEKLEGNMDLRSSQTEKNLLKAFAGESQARNRYSYYASVARKEGYMQISSIFQETADNEKEHAKRFFQFLKGGKVEITESFPAGIIGTTKENLLAAADGEKMEHSELYPLFADIAEQEGFKEIAAVFRAVAVAELNHEARFRKLLENIENEQVFKRDSKIKWKCRNCGYVHYGEGAPERCPACNHPQAYFQLKEENY
jgi:rubrerythrin